MEDPLFFFFATLMLVSGVLVAVSRNPVNGAMFMILSLVSMAGMFLLLEAFFLAILQVLVYAGAVMVLFLFIIMLLDIEVSSKIKPDGLTFMAAIVGALLLGFGLIQAIVETDMITAIEERPAIVENTAEHGRATQFATEPKSFGYLLFSKYMLPFQLTGFLLLVAMVGVIVLSKRFREDDEEEEAQA